MGLKFTATQLGVALDYITSNILAAYKVGLFSNAATPSETSVLSDFTPSTWPGYGLVNGSAFGAAALVAGEAVATAPPVDFTATAGTFSESVYGYFIADSSGTVLLYAELRPGGPVTIDTPGQIYRVTPKLVLDEL